jgi:hypothetical protein
MNWYVFSPMNGWTRIPDDTTGRKKVSKFVQDELDYYNKSEKQVKAEDFVIIRGQKHVYVPPQVTGSLLKAD